MNDMKFTGMISDNTIQMTETIHDATNSKYLLDIFGQLINHIDYLLTTGLKPFRIEYLNVQRNIILGEISDLERINI